MDKPVTICPFCSPPVERIFYVDELVIGLWDAYPVSPGHALLVPRRHVVSWFDATREEQSALLAAIEKAKAAIESNRAPHGYNIGVNDGSAAGQTIFHLHVHLIPRYAGDVTDPRGGVRYVLPSKANYITRIEDSERPASAHAGKLLWTGGREEPFAESLKGILCNLRPRRHCGRIHDARRCTGLTLRHIRSSRSRYQDSVADAGDYLDATDPTALIQLLDFESQHGPIALRVYQTHHHPSAETGLPTAFHPKSYIFEQADGTGTAFVGSSNLSKSALMEGVEWNYRVVSSRDGQGFREAKQAFEQLFDSPFTAPLTKEWIEEYKARRIKKLGAITEDLLTAPSEVVEVPKPHVIQLEALAALKRSRAEGAEAGLVVLATGLGKTWLSAFDSTEFQRVLFVAHREEILGQAMANFRKVRPNDYLGEYNGESKQLNADVLFASIQTLGKQTHLDRFPAAHFDYVVVDEFHHASAATYRRLLRHFKPRFLLGLTATPERSDGADLLDLCGGNLVYRCDLAEGISKDLLCGFDYFGVPDEVDYANIPWRSTKFDEEALTTAVATQSRAENAFDQLERRGGKRTLAFCVSQRHADFMAKFFRSKGKRAVAVHSGIFECTSHSLL